jgi:hypothetical protein
MVSAQAMMRKMMQANKDYKITDTDVRYRDLDVVATVKILAGDYKDVEFHFGSIHIPEEENADGTLTMSFDYDIISDHKELKENETFETTLGEILNDILMQSLIEAEKRYNNELGKKDTQASDLG